MDQMQVCTSHKNWSVSSQANFYFTGNGVDVKMSCYTSHLQAVTVFFRFILRF